MTKSIFEKAYLIKTQALNAAAKAVASGELVEGTFSLEQEGKKWKIVAIEVATVEPIHPELAAAYAQTDIDLGAVEPQSTDALIDEAIDVCQKAIGEIRENLDEENLAELDAGLAKADREANASMGVDAAKPRISICERPTKKVWDIADSMPKASRKDVMAECVRQGIAYGTARTQYQAWFKASQECDRMDIRKPYEKAEK